MKIRKFTLPLLVTVFIITGVAHADSEKIKIRTLFNIKEAYCSIKTNDVIGLDNRKSAYSGSGGGISSTNSLLLLENGENDITLEIGALGWFSDKNMSDENRSILLPQSECKLDVVKFIDNKTVTLLSIRIKSNSNGIPISESVNKENLVEKVVLAEQATPGYIDSKYFDPLYFPKGMTLFSFTKKLNISGVPEWSWIHAKKFTGDQEQKNKLRAAYEEIAKFINERDREKLRKSHNLALKAWSITTGDTEEKILASRYPINRLERGNIRIEPIVWDNYEIRTMNKGRLIQFYNKSKPTFSPLTYYFNNEKGIKVMGYYAPMFSLIDGKFVVVL